MDKDSVRFPHKLLVGSVFFFLVGVGLLLVTTGLLPRYKDLWPVPLTLLGLLFLYLVAVKGIGSGYFVPGMLFSLSGILLILHVMLFSAVPLDRFWPLFMTIAGISLFLYGLKFGGNTRVKIVVPAVSITLLSFIFLPFSLDIIDLDFSDVVVAWWPVIFLFLSGGLFVEYLRKKKE